MKKLSEFPISTYHILVQEGSMSATCKKRRKLKVKNVQWKENICLNYLRVKFRGTLEKCT